MKSFKVKASKTIRYEAVVVAENPAQALRFAMADQDNFLWEHETTWPDLWVDNDLSLVTEVEDFPYEEIRDPGGNYFETADAALQYKQDRFDWNGDIGHVWAVICTDTEEGTVYTYAHPFHYVNRIGFVLTKEPRQHEDEEYHEELISEAAE